MDELTIAEFEEYSNLLNQYFSTKEGYSEVIMQPRFKELEKKFLGIDRGKFLLRKYHDLEAQLAEANEKIKTQAHNMTVFTTEQVKLEVQLAESQRKLEKARDHFNSIIGKSHSWIITRETGQIEKPIHDSYRELARQALKETT